MRAGRAPVSFVLDAGALIALESADVRMTKLLQEVRSGKAKVVVSDGVTAQVWRGGSGRQARLATLLGLAKDRCLKIPIDTNAAKAIGVRIGESKHADPVDVHVALLAKQFGAAVITSDRNDILAVDPDLADVIVSI